MQEITSIRQDMEIKLRECFEAMTKAEADQHLEQMRANEKFDDLTRQTSSQIFEYKDHVVKLSSQIKELQSKVRTQ